MKEKNTLLNNKPFEKTDDIEAKMAMSERVVPHI